MPRKPNPIEVIVTESDEAMSPENLSAWARRYCELVLDLHTKEKAMDEIYIDRCEHGFEKYAGNRDTLGIVGWPSLFPERFKARQPVSVAPALRFLHVNEAKQLYLVSMDDPDDATWEALERHVAGEPVG